MHLAHQSSTPVHRAHQEAVLSGSGQSASHRALNSGACNVAKNARPQPSQTTQAFERHQRAQAAMAAMHVAVGCRGITPAAKAAGLNAQQHVQLKELSWCTRMLYHIGKFFDDHHTAMAYVNAVSAGQDAALHDLHHTFMTEAGWRSLAGDIGKLQHFSVRLDENLLSGHWHAALEQVTPIFHHVKASWQAFVAASGPERTKMITQMLVTGALTGGAMEGAGVLLGGLARSGMFADGVNVATDSATSVPASASSSLREKVLRNIELSRTARQSSKFEIHTLVNRALNLDVKSPEDKAIFWSGEGNKELAIQHASEIDGVTIDKTPGGKYLEQFKLFDRYRYFDARRPWEVLSVQYAKAASGDVTAFVDGASQDGIFYSAELPALEENDSVSSILYGRQFFAVPGLRR